MATYATEPTATSEPPKSRFHMDNDSSDTLTLPDGRKLGYAQYGSSTGKAVFYQHGHPGSRLEAAMFHDLGLEFNARIIATDRPGMGWSSPHPSRKLLDHPKDIEYLAEHLKLESYGVIGISGGGPYALACASSLPAEKLKCVSIVCGLGPPDIGMSGARWQHFLAFSYGYRLAPAFLLRWFWQRVPQGRLDLSDEERLELLLSSFKAQEATAHEKEKEVMKDLDFLGLSMRSARECFAQGFDAIAQDGKVMCSDFGFELENVRKDLPVQLWYGKHDVFVPLTQGEQIAARIGSNARLRVEEETHSSITVNWLREILKDVISAM